MRTAPAFLVGPVILVLVVAPAVVAQDDASMTEPAGVVITETGEDMVTDPRSSKLSTDAYWVHDGAVFRFTWDATDPRLSGTATSTGMWHGYHGLPGGVQLEALATTVTNDDGRWVGTGRGIFSEDAEFGDHLWLVMEGEGTYEGLTAYLFNDIAHEEDIWRGFIFADELPPFPEPAE